MEMIIGGLLIFLARVVRRRDIPVIMELVSQVDRAAFVTVDDANRVYRGHLRAAQRT